MTLNTSATETPPVHPGIYVKSTVFPKGLTVKEAAERIGIGRPALSNFLNGKASLSQSMAMRLEKAFGADKNQLLNMQQAYDAHRRKEDEKKIAVKSFTPSFLKITASQIEAWADKIESRALLAALLRRLVNTTGAEITHSNFPAHDLSQTHGWDGIVNSDNTTPWIPYGHSGWEFGCNKSPKSKADSDYQTRTEAIDESERNTHTFVFVTPRIWSKKDEWVKDVKSKDEWMDVRAYDANDLEQWLENSASAQVWMASQLGLPTEGCQTLDDYWRSWSEAADPPLSTRIFHSGCSDFAEKLSEWQKKEPEQPLVIAATSREEAMAFLYCLAEQNDPACSLLNQGLFVSTKEATTRLADISTSFIPIAVTEKAEQALAPLFRKRHCIVVTGRNIKGSEPDFVVELPSFESFKGAMEEMGFDEAQADIHSNQCGNSPTILRRQLAKLPSLKLPSWASSSEIIRSMIPFVLSGTWQTAKDADKEILSFLSGKDYVDLEKAIAELSALDDAPVWSEERHRGVVSKLDSLHAVADYITEKDIENFLFLAEVVLSEDDPALDLDKENRWAANVYNKVRDHSSVIREGFCQNLIMLSVHGNGLFGERLGINIELAVSALVQRLLRDQPPRVWLAQKNDLPSYAEAAPETYLDILEEELKQDNPAFEPLFEPVTGSMSGCDRTGLLWSLELLAWNPVFLSRVILILGKLAMYEIEDSWMNKPGNSVKDIFLFWKSHTAAPVEQRCEALDLLCEKYPVIGWRICIEPLEPGGSSTSGTYLPKWRNYASGAQGAATQGEGHQFVLKCLQVVMNWPSHSKDTLKDLVNCMSGFDGADRKKVADEIKKWAKTTPPVEEVLELREYIRTTTLTSRAIRHKDETNYASGKELYELLEPADPLYKYQWLFAKNWIEYTPEELEVENLDFSERDERINQQQVAALQDILGAHGEEGLYKTISRSGAGFKIGYLLYTHVLNGEEIANLISDRLLLSPEDTLETGNCISGILHQIPEGERADFITRQVSRIEGNENNLNIIARLCGYAPFDEITWRLVSTQAPEVHDMYWRSTHPGWKDFSPEEIDTAIVNLLAADRPSAAMQIAYMNKFKSVDSQHIEVILRNMAGSKVEIDHHYKIAQHHIEDALEALSKRDDFDRSRIAGLELLYVEALDFNSRYGIPSLSMEISESPELFFQFVALCFKRSDDRDDSKTWGIPLDPEQKGIAAKRAYSVLEAINVIPGSQSDGTVDTNILRAWVSRVRELAAEHSRAPITDQQIGKLLSTCSLGQDEVWPIEGIRPVLEETCSADICTGMIIGYQNSEGASFRSVDSNRERKSAENFRKMAEKVLNRHPFVGRMLTRLAASYDHHAEIWDADARVTKRLRGW